MADVTYRLETEIEPYLDPEKPGITLPWKITEYSVDPNTKKRELLKIKERTYTHGTLLQEEKTYDAHSHHRFTETKSYNNRRQLISKTNALEEKTLYAYDSNFNLRSEEKVGSGKWIYYKYDSQNHLTEKIEEDEQGLKFTTKHTYDPMGNCTSTTDHYGRTTTRKYDKLSREILVTDPLGYQEKKKYDLNNTLRLKVDKDGYTTKILNNIYGKPLKISHPDGTFEHFQYNLAGHLIKKGAPRRNV